jgi:hypothetical protein
LSARGPFRFEGVVFPRKELVRTRVYFASQDSVDFLGFGGAILAGKRARWSFAPWIYYSRNISTTAITL